MERNVIQKQRKKFFWKNALFPTIMAVCAFVCFVVVYILLTLRNYNPYPYYFLGLLFIIPSIVFAIIAYLSGKDKFANTTTITAALIAVFLLVYFFYLFALSMSLTTATVENPSQYKRTMRLATNPSQEQLYIFPKQIPDGATNITFYFNQSQWQEYCQTVVLWFVTDSQTLAGYQNDFEKQAVKIEAASDGLLKNTFDRVGEAYIKDLTPDYTVYTIINEGGHNRKVGAVAISQQKREVIFYAYEMRW